MTKDNVTVFKRSATNWKEFASAQKTVVQRGLTVEEAQRMCDEYNDNRTPAQVQKGTKLEWTADPDYLR